MDFLTAFRYILAIVETVALVGALIFATKALQTKKKDEAKKQYRVTSMVYFAVYVVLNILRNSGILF